MYPFTLPGYIQSASTGSSEIFTSCNLVEYLCSPSDATVSPQRSSFIRLEWESSFSNHYSDVNCSNGYLDDIGGNIFSNMKEEVTVLKHYTICTVRKFKLVLDKPYDGPTVVNGIPRIYLHTNLVLTDMFTESNVDASTTATMNITKRDMNGAIPCTDVTVMTLHPTESYIIVGKSDGDIQLHSPFSALE